MTPAAYRRGAPGKRISFTIVASALGRLLVGFTDAGVCAVALGDSDEALERSLRADFSRASIERASPSASAWVAPIVQAIGGKRGTAQVPLDVEGTAFQWAVWKALLRIPCGETRSHGELAEQLGR